MAGTAIRRGQEQGPKLGARRGRFRAGASGPGLALSMVLPPALVHQRAVQAGTALLSAPQKLANAG